MQSNSLKTIKRTKQSNKNFECGTFEAKGKIIPHYILTFIILSQTMISTSFFFLPIAFQHAKTILSFSSRKSLILNEFLVFSLKFCFLFRIKSGGTHRMPCGRALLFLILEWPPRTFPFLSFVAQIANEKQFSPVSDLIFWYLIAWFLPWRSL